MFNKDLDRLFQEKFKDFEEMPNNKIWKNIDKQINTKSRFNLLRIRLAGFVAVSLLLFFSLWYYNSGFSKNSNAKNENSIVAKDVDNTIIKNFDNETNYKTEIKNIEIGNTKEKKNSNMISVATNTKFKEHRIESKSEILSNKHKLSIQNKKNLNKKSPKGLMKKINHFSKLLNSDNIKNRFLVSNNLNESSLQMKPVVLQFIKNNLLLADLNSIKLDINKVAENNNKEKIVRWEVGSVVAPIYYASLTKGSPIDYHISENEQISSNSFSYGVDVAYRLNKKWSIKSGLKKQNLSYTTKDVGLEFKVESLNNNFVAANVHSDRGDFAFHSAKGDDPNQNVTFIGDVKQELNYIEFPIEVKYNLLSNKIGVDLNGGFSTLFLNKNEIIFQRAVSDFKLGEATNINKTDYTLNLGFDTNIKLSNSLKYSISPSFKYYLNTFLKNDGGFKPYSIGINTGLYYKF